MHAGLKLMRAGSKFIGASLAKISGKGAFAGGAFSPMLRGSDAAPPPELRHRTLGLRPGTPAFFPEKAQPWSKRGLKRFVRKPTRQERSRKSAPKPRRSPVCSTRSCRASRATRRAGRRVPSCAACPAAFSADAAECRTGFQPVPAATKAGKTQRRARPQTRRTPCEVRQQPLHALLPSGTGWKPVLHPRQRAARA